MNLLLIPPKLLVQYLNTFLYFRPSQNIQYYQTRLWYQSHLIYIVLLVDQHSKTPFGNEYHKTLLLHTLPAAPHTRYMAFWIVSFIWQLNQRLQLSFSICCRLNCFSHFFKRLMCWINSQNSPASSSRSFGCANIITWCLFVVGRNSASPPLRIRSASLVRSWCQAYTRHRVDLNHR